MPRPSSAVPTSRGVPTRTSAVGTRPKRAALPTLRRIANHQSKHMKPIRIALALALTTFSLLPSSTRAQDFPTQDIRFICGFPAGSGADVLVRYFGEKVRLLAGRTIIVENKAGAAGNIAAVYTARAKPDGHTVYVHAASAI